MAIRVYEINNQEDSQLLQAQMLCAIANELHILRKLVEKEVMNNDIPL